MQIKLFQETGLNRVDKYLKSTNMDINELTLRSLLKQSSIHFSLENCNRLISTLFCELGLSYVQQSQRYVKMTPTGYSLPGNISSEFEGRIQELIEKSFDLYKRMTELKDDIEAKGRPKLEYYKHGIPIEDGRYILPLACNTHLVTALSGDQLIDIYRLIQNPLYAELFKTFKTQLDSFIPAGILKHIEKCAEDRSAVDIEEEFYRNYLKEVSTSNNLTLIESFDNPVINVGLGAITSTQSAPPSVTYAKWGEDVANKSKGVAERVIGYGHYSITEQARTTFGMMMSLTTYHQFIRHRLPKNYRETLSDLINDKDREVIVPPTIAKSQFLNEYLDLVNEFKDLREEIYIKDKEGAFSLLLNCDQIKVISNTNARIDTDIMKERTCLNAQWEIRDLYIKKLKILRNISEILYREALPSCMRGKCKEGKLSCGKPDVVRGLIGG